MEKETNPLFWIQCNKLLELWIYTQYLHNFYVINRSLALHVCTWYVSSGYLPHICSCPDSNPTEVFVSPCTCVSCTLSIISCLFLPPLLFLKCQYYKKHCTWMNGVLKNYCICWKCWFIFWNCFGDWNIIWGFGSELAYLSGNHSCMHAEEKRWGSGHLLSRFVKAWVINRLTT